jgi:hypothetical protein
MGQALIFQTYGMLKTQGVDIARLNKALAIAQRKAQDSRYYTTQKSCTCPDCTYRGSLCKHRLAKMLLRQFSLGDRVAPIFFPELAGEIEQVSDGLYLLNGYWYEERELITAL